MLTVAANEIAEIVGGRIIAQGNAASIAGVSTDTRTLGTISNAPLFVAIQGPHFDAHTMITEAATKGAVAVMVEKDVPIPLGVWGIRVESTIAAMGNLARWWRMCHAMLPVVAVAGSNGKSTTKQMVAGALQPLGDILATEGNFNNLIGLPLTVFRLSPQHRAAVLELGMSARGEVAQLTQIANPDVGVITNVYPEHMEFLLTLEEVAKAEGELFETMRPDGTIVVNMEDPWVQKQAANFPGQKITYGMQNDADIRFGHMVANGLESIDLNLSVFGRSYNLHLPVPGAHNVMNAMAALGCALALGVKIDDALQGITRFQPMKMRMERLQLANGVQVINDCYNASPDSMAAALRTVSVAKRAGRLMAVLGDMLELGGAAAELHGELGRSIPGYGVNHLFTFGELGQNIAQGARQAGLADVNITASTDMDQLKKAVAAVVQPGDIILVKGSRGMKMERVIDHLKHIVGVL